MVGGTESGLFSVLNDQILPEVRVFPDGSLMPVVIITLINAPYGSGKVGVKVAVLPSALQVILPAIAVAPLASVKVPVLMVAVAIASLKLTVTSEFVATLRAFSTGTTEMMVGAVRSEAAAVLNDQVLLAAMALPARSFTPVETVIEIRLEYGRAMVGVKVAVLASLLKLMLPGISTAPLATEKVLELRVAEATVSLNLIAIFV